MSVDTSRVSSRARAGQDEHGDAVGFFLPGGGWPSDNLTTNLPRSAEADGEPSRRPGIFRNLLMNLQLPSLLLRVFIFR